MTATCTFCERQIYTDKVLMDLNNNTYCEDCAKEKFSDDKLRGRITEFKRILK